jgi:hypothetical protein
MVQVGAGTAVVKRVHTLCVGFAQVGTQVVTAGTQDSVFCRPLNYCNKIYITSHYFWVQ